MTSCSRSSSRILSGAQVSSPTTLGEPFTSGSRLEAAPNSTAVHWGLRRQSPTARAVALSSTSRTLRASTIGVNGFCRNACFDFTSPLWTIARSA